VSIHSLRKLGQYGYRKLSCGLPVFWRCKFRAIDVILVARVRVLANYRIIFWNRSYPAAASIHSIQAVSLCHIKFSDNGADLKIIVFRDVMPYSLVRIYRRLRGIYFLPRADDRGSSFIRNVSAHLLWLHEVTSQSTVTFHNKCAENPKHICQSCSNPFYVILYMNKFSCIINFHSNIFIFLECQEFFWQEIARHVHLTLLSSTR
jgi:hypothetical protein